MSLIPHNNRITVYFRITVKPSRLEKLKIMQNIIKLMFQVIFIFSDWIWILIKQIIVSFTPFVLRETFSKIFTWRFKRRTGASEKMNRFNAFSRNVNTINWKIFPKHSGIYKLEKIQQTFLERDKTLKSLKKYDRMYNWDESWRAGVVSNTVYQFLGYKFSWHNTSVFFSSNITYFLQK